MKKFILSFILMGALVAPVTSRSAAPKSDPTGWIIPAVITAGTLYYIWSHWDNSRPVFSQSKAVSVATSRSLEGITKHQKPISVASAEQAVNIIQRPVMQQGKNNDGGASCGYHALKNAIGVLTKKHDLFTDKDFIKKQFSLDPGTWREWVQRKQGDNGEWIHTEFYADLIASEFKRENIRCGWTIINSHGQPINNAHVGEDIYGIFQMLKLEDTYKHAFFINTADGYTVGQHGHWFVVIMEKEAYGKTTYTVMDSLGHKRHADNTVWTIIESIHGTENIARPEVLESEKQKTKFLLLDVVKSLSSQQMKTRQREDLISMILDLNTTLVAQNAVDDEIKQAMDTFRSSLQ